MPVVDEAVVDDIVVDVSVSVVEEAVVDVIVVEVSLTVVKTEVVVAVAVVVVVLYRHLYSGMVQTKSSALLHKSARGSHSSCKSSSVVVVVEVVIVVVGTQCELIE